MVFLLNLLFAVFAFLVVRYALDELGADRRVSLVVALLAALIVGLANFGVRV